MKLCEIYINGEEEEIKMILDFVKPLIGIGINVVDLCPKLDEEYKKELEK